MLSTKIEDLKFVVFDLETTGLKASEEQIIEIAAKKVDARGNEYGTFHKFVNLYKKERIDPFIVNLTNITEALLDEEGEDIDEVMDEFLQFIDDSILVAQNAKFDMGFLIQYYLKDNHHVFSRICLDTINLAKSLKPGMESYKLSVLTGMFGVDYDTNSHHRADYDVEITTNVLLAQLGMLDNIDTLEGLLEVETYRFWSEKQESFLTKLLNENGKNNLHKFDCFSVATASEHIGYFLDKK